MLKKWQEEREKMKRMKERKKERGHKYSHLSAKPTSSSDSPDDGNNSTGLSCCGLAFLLLRFFNVGMLYSPSCNVKEYHILIHILKIRTSIRWHTPQKKKKRHNQGGNQTKIYTNFAHTAHQITEFRVKYWHNHSALHTVLSYMTTYHFVTWKQVAPASFLALKLVHVLCCYYTL